jgi:hypothetical protein
MFDRLPRGQQTHIRTTGQKMVGLAMRYAIPVIYAPPVSLGGKPQGGTAWIVRIDEDFFFVTARHILTAYQKRISDGEQLNWHIGALPLIDPISRIHFEDKQRDIVFLRLSEEEATLACADSSWIYSPSTGWPAREPRVGELALISGFPEALRSVADGSIKAGPCSAAFTVTTSVNGSGCFCCQIERADLISYNGQELPPPDTEFGGWSGGPVLLAETLSYPVVGIVKEYSADFGVLIIASLAGIHLP